MKILITMLNSKYIHSSLAPWYLLSGVRAYCDAEIEAEVAEATVNENINVSQSNTSFEVELYVRDSSCLILDVLFLAMFHIHII